MIKKITLEINGKEIELSLEDAKKLYGELGELFKGAEIKYFPVYPTYPTYPTYPWVTYHWSSENTGGSYSAAQCNPESTSGPLPRL